MPETAEKQRTIKKTDKQETDVAGLSAMLQASVKGEVRFDNGSRGAYATDGSNYRQVPMGVVLPLDEEDIINTARICRQFQAPLVSRGGGTSLAGQCCNVAVIMDMSKYYRDVLSMDADNKRITVQPGIALDDMKKVTGVQGLTFGPDPSTHQYCTIGGMLGNNACGVHSVMAQHAGYGARMSDNTESMTILTYDGFKMKVGPTSEEELEQIIQKGGRKGEIYRRLKALRDKYEHLIREKFPDIPRRVSGYNLDELLPEKGFNVAKALVGTEGTCVVVLDATLKLIDNPVKKSLLVLGYPDVYSAGRHVLACMQHQPIGLEGIDDELIGYMKERGMHPHNIPLLPEGKGWLMVEFGGNSREEANNKARKLMKQLEQEEQPPSMRLFDQEGEEGKIWELRESGLGATAFVPNMADTWPGWEDSAVPPGKVGDYLQDLRKLFDQYGYDAALYGHFGQGCIHCRINFDMVTKEGLDTYKKFTRAAARLVMKYGGSISGEHGDGQARGDLLEIMYGKEIVEAFHEFKSIWDPDWKMNPGKVVESYGRLANLRLGTEYNPERTDTHFRFPEDQGDFARAALRCVGVGKCRRSEGGTMCPSYMVTREEIHTTRGRARLLFEMLQGEEISEGWKSEAVKEALDLCLSCKGCKSDCPVNVDMATYKAEFLSHYYQGKLRPRTAYAFGFIFQWARLASVMPGIVNFVTQAPVFRDIMKRLAGVAPQRTLPKFAATTFKSWFRNRSVPRQPGSPPVILWADTFNNFFLPETLVAGTEVLEAAGFEVLTPGPSLCCGRPLYDFGMLNTAKRLLQEILQTLRPAIRQGIPVVGLEPSCVAVFRDELYNLFPHDEDALRLREQTFTLAEFLEKKAPHFHIPPLQKKVLLHGHCHHKAIMKMSDDKQLLERIQLDVEAPATGCCGMAGYFGYEKGTHYEVSVKAGEHQLLPRVREAAPSTIILADGFSCREQIEQETNRKGMHLAQVIQMALREKDQPVTNEYPERRYVDDMKLRDPGKKRRNLLIAACLVAGLAITAVLLKKRISIT